MRKLLGWLSHVSISLSSGFSFQALWTAHLDIFLPVSISLSSGFSIQGQRHVSFMGKRHVSISLSSGFSIQGLNRPGLPQRFQFQSRYRAASQFRQWRNAPQQAMSEFQSRYRAASHFRIGKHEFSDEGYHMFQSRYRAASHFRCAAHRCTFAIEEVSISLSSGFSFQDYKRLSITSGCISFQSRYRAASHFRHDCIA